MNDSPNPDIAKHEPESVEPYSEAAQQFTGTAELRRFPPTEQSMRIGHVTFHEGAQTRWHHHHGLQVLVFVTGKGEVSTRDGHTIPCVPGDVVSVMPNVSHRHGAAQGEEATHWTITSGGTFWEE